MKKEMAVSFWGVTLGKDSSSEEMPKAKNQSKQCVDKK